ncbi:MAG TPA: sensor domain-containing protein [Mycobacterium sp.]|uniref:sensor domain-containing protein n=1 Tax=Mycobacterium sp. TaxID=1785 RepID=UPI002D516528|nr:sensor domain-containing protein [Mycobacterium sp.]HZU48578.1 sensor domain-containing protein [Mycobacterium sp.]
MTAIAGGPRVDLTIRAKFVRRLQLLCTLEGAKVMKRVGRVGAIAASVIAALLATSCSAVVAGQARPVAGIAPRPVIGVTIQQALLGKAELSKLLDQSVSTLQPPRYGGATKLFRSLVPGAGDCLGVLAEMQSSSYRSADVRDVAWESWLDARTAPAAVIAVDEGVVALPTAAEANALFAAFADQWNRCDGKAATYRDQTYRITDVRVADSVLAATLQTSPTLVARAIGVRVNCLVEVKVPFSADARSAPGSPASDPETRAIEVARLMMDKISDLS